MKIYCVTNGEVRADLDHVVYASASKCDAILFAHTYGFYDSSRNANIEVLDVTENFLTIDNIKNLKKCSSVDLDIMLKACANAVSDRVEDGSALFISNKDDKYEKYEWMTILNWICDIHSELFEGE